VKLAFLFPGQGMQEPGMTAMLGAGSPMRLYLERTLGMDLSRPLERGGAQLERTDVLQPTLVAASLAVMARLTDSGIRPDVVAGHSVGEIAALAAAGGITVEEAIELAAVRGRLMAREAASHPGGMVALLQATAAMAEAAIAVGARDGVVGLAAVNAPDQRVIAGEAPALQAIASAFGGHRLPVTGAWHSRLMAGALPELVDAFNVLPIRPLHATLVVNRSGRPLGESEDLVELIAGQLVRPVQWLETLRTMVRLEITDILTIGPGRIMRGLIRKSLGSSVRVHTTEADLGRTIDAFKRGFND